MEFIILFLVVGSLGYLVFQSTTNKSNFSVDNSLGEVVFTHNCYFLTHTDFGKRTDPIIYRIYYNNTTNNYSLRGYGNGWEEHGNYKQVFEWYRGVVEGVYRISCGRIIYNNNK